MTTKNIFLFKCLISYGFSSILCHFLPFLYKSVLFFSRVTMHLEPQKHTANVINPLCRYSAVMNIETSERLTLLCPIASVLNMIKLSSYCEVQQCATMLTWQDPWLWTWYHTIVWQWRLPPSSLPSPSPLHNITVYRHMFSIDFHSIKLKGGAFFQLCLILLPQGTKQAFYN